MAVATCFASVIDVHCPPPVHWVRRHPAAADAILASVVTAVSLAALWGGSRHVAAARDPDALATVLTVLGTAPIALRRRHPTAVLAVVGLASFTIEALGYYGPTWISVFIAVATVAARVNERARSTTVKALIAAAIAMFAAGLTIGRSTVAELISASVFLTGAFILGDNLQRRRRASAELAERAVRTERERELIGKQRIQDERSRVARELHDVVAHSVSLMIIQAGAARRSIATSPTQAEAALKQIEATGRDAMEELRRVLGVLRAGDGADALELSPQPSLDTVRELVTSDSSLPVRLDEVGPRPAEVPSSVGLSLYRVVQEALTNVRKHSGHVKNVGVHISYEPDRVVVHVVDDGRGASVGVNLHGHGLVGMRERMALCGGTVTAGPRPGGGWQVRATAPLHEVAV